MRTVTILLFLLVFLMLIPTVFASNVEFSNMSFIMKQGESKQVYILLENPPENFYLFTDEYGFITFNNGYEASLNDLDFIQENVYSLNFNIDVPSYTKRGIYTQDIEINGYSKNVSVSIDVKHNVIVNSMKWFNQSVNIASFQITTLTIVLCFIFLSTIVIIFLLFNSVRNK